ncbi:MAG: hypothetical protein FJ086_06695 [Deltaproteobacteria bacterium]|nr:hypothetical protein [Deltaproteobacteria bacterium]
MDTRRRWLWPVLAGACFALAAWLMLRGEAEQPSERRVDQVKLPRHATRDDFERQEQRRTWSPPPPPAGTPPPRPDEQPVARDPLLLALPIGRNSSALVVEANALANSPAGELLVQCFQQRTRGRGLERVKEQMGIDPLKDVDRVALWDDGAMVTGSFQGFPWDMIAERHEVTRYGEGGTLYRPKPEAFPRADGGPGGADLVVGRWRDQLLFFVDSEEAAKEVMDRLEGRLQGGPGSLTEDMAYGEFYGTLDAKDLGELFPDDDPGLKEAFLKGAERVVLHVDAARDVGLVAEVQGPGGEGLGDVAKSLGGALALARVKAAADGDADLAELLELARVNRRPDGRFGVELALPLEFLQKRLSQCEPAPERPTAVGPEEDGPDPAAAP